MPKESLATDRTGGSATTVGVTGGGGEIRGEGLDFVAVMRGAAALRLGTEVVGTEVGSEEVVALTLEGS